MIVGSTGHLDEEDLAAWSAWREAAALPEVRGAIRSLYEELDAAVAARGPTCWVSGECCKFDAYGHRLYVTGLEIAVFLQRTPQPPRKTDAAEPPVSAGQNDSADPVAAPLPATHCGTAGRWRGVSVSGGGAVLGTRDSPDGMPGILL